MTDIGFHALCRDLPYAERIKHLYISKNKIRTIPPEFRRFSNLEMLLIFKQFV